MTARTVRNRFGALLIALMIGFSAIGLTAGTAQAAQHRAKNFAQRHPTATSLAAGIAAYKIAKKTGHNREMRGGRKNFAQRHPFLTGMGTAMATHHVIKKSIKNRQ